MKKMIFYVLLFLPFFCFSDTIPVLNPSDPQFAWMDALIDKDFAKVKRHISIKNYQEAIEKSSETTCIVRFRIINNRVEAPPEAVGSPCFNMLEYLCQTYGLPNLDFLYWNQDGPWKSVKGKVPILTGARANKAKNTLLFSDWLFDIKNPSGPWNQERKIIDDAYHSLKWSKKENRLFWRGTGSDVWNGGGNYSTSNWASHARGKACYLSRKEPEYIDAAFTGFQPFHCVGGQSELLNLKKAVPMSPQVSLIDHLKYKYQLQISGCMASFPRDRWQFYSASVVFRHPHPHEMYWYSLLEPWKHYIPVESSMDDLIKKVQWARLNDKKCRKIAKNGRAFAKTHFLPEHIALYSYKVLMRYAQIQAFDPAGIKN